jgi:HlyD family type I secretion membrane fusion protein
MIDEGQRVEEGAVLVRLDASALRSELAIVESQLFEVMARRARLEAERDETSTIRFAPLLTKVARTNADTAGLMAGQERLLKARAASIGQEIKQMDKQGEQLRKQIEGVTSQEVALDRQLVLIGQELGNQQSLLEQGLAQATRVLSLQREEARLSGAMGELAAQKARAHSRISEIELGVLKLRSRRREEAIAELRDLQFREVELRERRRALLERMTRLDIAAPVSGVVYDLQVFARRSVLRPADPVLYLIPQDRPLVINARVPPVHIDKLRIGQDVSLRFSALDQREHRNCTGHGHPCLGGCVSG